MSLFLIENNVPEPKEVINESGGAHQKLARLRIEKYKKAKDEYDNAKKEEDDILKGKSKIDLRKMKKIGEIERKFNNLTPPWKEKDRMDSASIKPEKGSRINTPIGTFYSYNHPSYSDDTWHDKEVRSAKKSLGVGKGNIPEERKPGLYKKLQDAKKHEAFDMCADYVVGCLEGSIDDFDLDLFTEATSFIIDCLDE